MMYPHNKKKQKIEQWDQSSQTMEVSEQNQIESTVLRRNKTPKISIPTVRSEKYKSDGGTPALLEKLTLYPKACVIESKGETKQGVQAKVDIAKITTTSQSEIDIFRKKHKKGECSNEFSITDSIKKNPDYEKVKAYLSIPFYEEKRISGNVTYSRLKRNGDLDNYREYIKKNQSVAQRYLFHQTTNLVKTLDFLHNQTFIDEQGNQHPGIIHGDIKPDNILVDEEGKLTLSDFGCARYADKPIEQLGMVSYLSPEILRVPGGIPSNSDKSDIWSLGTTLQHLMTDEYPIAPNCQSIATNWNENKDTRGYSMLPPLSMDQIKHNKDTRGYSMLPPLSMNQIKHNKDKRGYTIVASATPVPTDHVADFFSDSLQGHEFRKNKAEQYLQSVNCENNLSSKYYIDDLCQKPYQQNMDQSEVFRHLTASLLTPVEARPNAQQLSTTMEKLGQYFPWDHKNNTEFVKRMTESKKPVIKETYPSGLVKKEKKLIEQTQFKLSAERQAHKLLLDNAIGGLSSARGFFSGQTIQEKPTHDAQLTIKQNPWRVQPNPLTANRQAHKALLDDVLGGTPISSSFFNSNFVQKTKKEESEAKSSDKLKTMLWG